MTSPTLEKRSGASDYRSELFQSFAESVGALKSDLPVLDLGPANSDNLMFWIRRGRPVTARDLGALARRGEALDLDGRRFGGVVCWNALALIPESVAAEAVKALVAALVPGGQLFAIFDGDGRSEPDAVRYRILDDGRLRFEPADGSASPRPVATREIQRLLEPFRPARTTVLRHGAREALGQIPRPPSDPFPAARSLTDDESVGGDS